MRPSAFARSQAYHIFARRTRRHLERSAPDIFGPHILVRGQPILSDENQKWASQLYYTHYWGEEYDLMGDGVGEELNDERFCSYL